MGAVVDEISKRLGSKTWRLTADEGGLDNAGPLSSIDVVYVQV